MRNSPKYFLPTAKRQIYKERICTTTLVQGDCKTITFATTTSVIEKDAPGFKGAVVITPEPGYYTDPVSCLDFASLYPSIMRYRNMCHSTLVSWGTIESHKLEEHRDFHRIPNCTIDEEGHFQALPSANDVCFLSERFRPGILPRILHTLLSERKRAKKEMKAAKDPGMYKVLDGKQLALKCVCNSLYGFCGTHYGPLPCKEIAESVTSTGRFLALSTKAMCEQRYRGVTCVYGDT